MANNSILGGSPLGLIGVKSSYTRTGMSTFNAGETRNINVIDYNKNKSDKEYGNSLFTGNRVVRAWPEITKVGDGEYDTKGTGDVDYVNKKDKSVRRVLHNNVVYDTSLLNIIEQLSGTNAQLRPSDFAYLKNIGVYPNNRLMIARRFGAPVDDNIMTKKKNSDVGPFSVLISWLPENDNFLDINFGEEWEDAQADFKEILTSLGKDLAFTSDMGGVSSAGGNILPMPGFTETFQRGFLAKIGVLNEEDVSTIPAGNPNIIKKAKKRKLIGYGDQGSGLKCTVNIKMTCDYELKYISGIDPTIVWMDLIGMITRFGTSNSDTYGLTKEGSQKAIRYANNPNLLIEEAAEYFSGKMTEIIATIQTKVQELVRGVDEKKLKGDFNTAINEQFTAFKNKFKDGGKQVLSALLQKYRTQIIGVINALSGLPSTPWHITIGNPLRPTFCSGDMLVEDVKVKLGPTLAFNDLPNSITVEFDLKNARPWGLQEIVGKFNSGYLRTIDVQKSFYETNNIIVNGEEFQEPYGILPMSSNVTYGTTSSTPRSSNNGGNTTESSSDSNPTIVNKSENGSSPNDGDMSNDPNSPAIKN